MSASSRSCGFPPSSALAGRAARIVLAVALAAPAVATAGEAPGDAVFAIDDEPGVIHLSDRADAGPGVAVRRLAGALPVAAPRPGVAEIVAEAARLHGVDEALLHAVIRAESGYAARAVSPRGAAGLMQLMPATARQYGVTDVFDARQNIDAGARVLRVLLDRYHHDTARALAAYNAGPAASARGAWPAETAAYVPRVLALVAASPSRSLPSNR